MFITFKFIKFIRLSFCWAQQIWCDIHTDGGGWALVGMKDSPVSWTVPSNPTLLILKDPHIGRVISVTSTFWTLEFNFQLIKVLKEQRQTGKEALARRTCISIKGSDLRLSVKDINGL